MRGDDGVERLSPPNELPYRLADMITDIVLPEQKKEERKSDASRKKDDGDSPGRGPFVPSAELVGVWNGMLVTYQGEQRLRLDIKDTGDVHVRLDRQLLTLLNNPSFRDGFLRGVFAGEANYDDARGRRHHLHLKLTLGDAVLNGPVMAITLPDAWGSSAVTHWAEIKRQSGEK